MPIFGTVPITAPVAPTSALDSYPSHIAEYGKGGCIAVEDNTERNAITTERRTYGMLVHVRTTGIWYKLGSGLTNSDWLVAFSSSVLYVAQNLALMRAIPSSSTNNLCFLLGYATAGDGSGGVYYWDNASSLVDSPMTVVRPTDFTSAGLWKQFS